MLRRSLEFSLFIVLAALIGVATSYAQTLRTIDLYKAHIPYDFAIGSKEFKAGDYKLRLKRAGVDNTAVLVALETAKGDILSTAVGMKNWKPSKDDRAYLVFCRFGEGRDIYALEQIAAPNLGYSVRTKKTATSVRVSKNLKKEFETVTVLLTRLE